MVEKIVLILFSFLLLISPDAIHGDQIRGVIVDPNAPQTPAPASRTTPETIYFLTTPSEGGDHLDFTTPQSTRRRPGQPTDGYEDETGKWIRRTTGFPVYQRTTEDYGRQRPTEDPNGPDERSFGRTTSKYRPLRITTEPQEGGDETTEDRYQRQTTDRYSRFGSRQTTPDPSERQFGRTTPRYSPFRTTPRSGEEETTEDPYQRRTTDRYSRFGSRQTTPDPSERQFGRTTPRYSPFRTTPRSGEEETTEDPYYQRYTTTDRYSRFGVRQSTPDPFDRFGSRTTSRYSPFGSRYTTPSTGEETETDRYSARYTTTEGPVWGRRTTPDYGSRRGQTTEDYFRRDRDRTTSRYSGRWTTTPDEGGSEGTRGGEAPDTFCQRTTKSSFVYGRNVCLEYINCCQRTCLGQGLKPKGNCRHDISTGFDRTDTFCNCKRAPPEYK